MALLHRLLDAGADPRVCHVDHGVRPDAADDARWVKAQCEALGVPCVIRRVRPSGASEAALREARYAALLRTAREQGASEVHVAHTLDDQAETVMMRLERGARLRGLGGMRPRRPLGPGVDLVRPLLGERRADLRRWLEARGVTWREDPSNADLRHARNRLRAAGLPLPAATLARVADAAQAAWDHLDGPWDGDLDTLAELPRLVRRMRLEGLAGGELEERHLRALESLAGKSAGHGGVDLPGGRRVVREHRRLRLGPLPPPRTVLTFELAARGVGAPPGRDAPEAWFDADALRFPLTVRSRRPGDRLRPFGGRGRRKLQDVLVDAKVPRALRDAVPLVVQGEDVLWVPGVIRADAAPIRSHTKRVLRIRRGP